MFAPPAQPDSPPLPRDGEGKVSLFLCLILRFCFPEEPWVMEDCGWHFYMRVVTDGYGQKENKDNESRICSAGILPFQLAVHSSVTAEKLRTPRTYDWRGQGEHRMLHWVSMVGSRALRIERWNQKSSSSKEKTLKLFSFYHTNSTDSISNKGSIFSLLFRRDLRERELGVFLFQVVNLFQSLRFRAAITFIFEITVSSCQNQTAAWSHTHPSHSQTLRLLTTSLSLGVPVPHATQCIQGV
jgi:hypothetical protein